MKKSAMKQLTDYLDKEDSGMFDEQGVKLQVDVVNEIEQRGIAAMIVASKPSFRDQVGEAVMTDVFKQGLGLMRLCNRQLATLKLLMIENELDENTSGLLQALTCKTQVEVMDMDDSLTKLMQSILHVLKPKRAASS